MILLCDLDGVVWLAHEPISGSVESLGRWLGAGHEVVFVTNNSSARIAEQEGFLSDIGIDARGRVVSSATATGRLVTAGERVLVVGGGGIVEAVENSHAVALSQVALGDAVDAVVVGIDREFTYEKLATASAAVRGGARLIATNHDPTYPTPRGLTPGGGAIVAAVAYASETEPIYAGKPHRTMFETAINKAELLTGRAVKNDDVVVVGDRIDSDGVFARNAGVRFCHVRSGVDRGDGIAESYDDLRCVITQLLERSDG